MIKTKLENVIKQSLKTLSIETESVVLEHPDILSHGDYATNVALAHAKALKINPRELAEKIVVELEKNKSEEVEVVEIAGPGFINFKLKKEFFNNSISEIIEAGDDFGKNAAFKGKKVLCEYTDPNPFKVFHIGHLMSNAIGESISRIFEYHGADIVRMTYGGDVGLHVARTMWAILRNKEKFPKDNDPLEDRTSFLGSMYVIGSNKYEDDPEAKKEIDALNKVIFEKSDAEINAFYEKGKKWSIEHFQEIYKKLGSQFQYQWLESEVAEEGVNIVEEFSRKGIFEKSEGATVFRGEVHDPKLHTRVFINSLGLPTYETKELGLNKRKFEVIKPDVSVIVTATEQSDYFKVLLKVFELILPHIHKGTKHVSHGMLRFASGKMSSRKGNVITGESLLEDVEELVLEKVAERELSEEEKQDIAEKVSVGAIKYSILKQSAGSDIIYDFEKSISFEGDSGPYLQYSHTRALSVLEKAKKENIASDISETPEEISDLEKMLYRFPEVVERAGKELQPHYIASYLIEIAGLYNAYYAKYKIVDSSDKTSPYKVALTKAVAQTIKNGLYVLGIKAPEKM